ncbi:hypothetical protein BCR43DRAFT_488401 [Syncephalastrum racemosum]|uniref:Uncharacterized protein n=1 Tax=Syncephalastrum racemosum TaxID=13706 RepID=A0A1X2HIM9_SYNRA|nr:hypothetical protein BCR43DRAFT_488401 [Syncephalastrum racemosum]
MHGLMATIFSSIHLRIALTVKSLKLIAIWRTISSTALSCWRTNVQFVSACYTHRPTSYLYPSHVTPSFPHVIFVGWSISIATYYCLYTFWSKPCTSRSYYIASSFIFPYTTTLFPENDSIHPNKSA